MALFMNTGIVILIANANLGEDSASFVNNLFNGSYDDYNNYWYSDVGIKITYSMLISSVSPAISTTIQIILRKIKIMRD
jgi:hypothetical protein